MDFEPERISDLASRFPGGFEFYHLGEVRALEDAVPPLTADELLDQQGIAFRIQGEVRALAVLTVDAGLDASVYSEMGNVIVSRFANELDAVISPPTLLQEEQLDRIFKAGRPALSRTYLHLHENQGVKVRISLFPARGAEEAAHA